MAGHDKKPGANVLRFKRTRADHVQRDSEPVDARMAVCAACLLTDESVEISAPQAGC
jgi:hypothetical protein